MSLAPQIDLAALAARYDAFLVDQFGVLRDEDGAYPGGNDALLRLKALGKTVIVLSATTMRSGSSSSASTGRASTVSSPPAMSPTTSLPARPPVLRSGRDA
jgi:ribonucleotide monophosphatase NagD (HAD superfamily)